MAKFKRVSTYEVNQRNELGQYTATERFIYNPSVESILTLLEEGPCNVIFNRVYYKKPGVRGMICIRPQGTQLNAFVPKYPDLIAVIDLDLKKWRSVKYGEIIILERLRQKDLTYGQRSTVSKIRGGDWDYLWPGDEGDSLQPDNLNLGEKRFP